MKKFYILYLIYGFGILWHAIPYTRNFVLILTPYVLLLTCMLVIYPEQKEKNFRLIVWLALVFILTFLIETAGVKTGNIFGEYSYGETLGTQAFGVPFIIGLNWAVIIWGCAEIASRINTGYYLKIAIASIAAVLLDILIEPAAVSFGYWTWTEGQIPFQNYAAWFIIAMLFSAVYLRLNIKPGTTLPVHFYFSQVLFFGILNIIVV